MLFFYQGPPGFLVQRRGSGPAFSEVDPAAGCVVPEKQAVLVNEGGDPPVVGDGPRKNPGVFSEEPCCQQVKSSDGGDHGMQFFVLPGGKARALAGAEENRPGPWQKIDSRVNSNNTPYFERCADGPAVRAPVTVQRSWRR